MVPIWVSFNSSGDEDPNKIKKLFFLRNKYKIVFFLCIFQISFVFTKIRVQVLILQLKAQFFFNSFFIARTQLGFDRPFKHQESCFFGTP